MRSTASPHQGCSGSPGVVVGLDDQVDHLSMLDSKTLVRMMALLVQTVRVLFRSRADLALENLALRQQVAVLKQKRPRPSLTGMDRAFWVALRQTWKHWANALIIVQPDTVVRWHQRGFKIYWRWKSKPRGLGRPCTHREIRALVRRMATENPTWGAPRIQGELLKLGFEVSERTVSRYMPRRPPAPDKIESWKTFLRNHRNAVAACDFFTVPTITFDVLYIFFVVHHARRKVLHVNVTTHPTAAWVIQQCGWALHHEDRTHLGLDKDTPVPRPVTPRPCLDARVVALPRVGGLHHRYE